MGTSVYPPEGLPFEDALTGLRNGDFSALDPHLPAIFGWFEEGKFGAYPEELAEALSCACFNGRTEIVRRLLDAGLDPLAGQLAGLNGFHWAANRGQFEAVALLIERGTPMEGLSMYGGTVLGTVIWSAINEPRDGQIAVIDALLTAGADPALAHLDECGSPTGNGPLVEVLRKHGLG